MPRMSRDRPQVTLRPLETRQDCLTCVSLQREIWGADFIDVVPATILMVTQRVGGVAVGAFDATGGLIGFVFGISGVTDGTLAHWSDMLGVRSAARRLGLGRRLKLHQRARLLERGIRVVYWSYDPLVARNASFNLNTLGAYPTEYVVDMYGDTGSALHRGLDTDRIIVTWQLDDPDVERRVAGERPNLLPDTAEETPIVIPLESDGSGADHSAYPTAGLVRVAVPADIGSLKTTDPEEARRWQRSVREAFRSYLKHGYRVAGFCEATETTPPAYVLTTQPIPGRDR